MASDQVPSSVNEGDVYDLECMSQGRKTPTDGIFKYEGMVIIVPNTDVGIIYRIKITAVKQTVAFGKIVNQQV